MRIYNKKRFIIGILFLGLFAISVVTLLNQFNNRSTINIIKSIVTSLLSLFIGLNLFYTSINKEENKKADIEEIDERNKLIELNASNLVNKILTYLFWIIEFLFVLLWYKTKVDELLIVVVVFGFLISMKLVLDITTLIYYERKI